MSLDSFIHAFEAMHARFTEPELGARRRRARERVDRAQAERQAAHEAFEAWPRAPSHERVRRAEAEWEDAIAVGQEFSLTR